MTKKQQDENERKKPEPMVVYDCPYCGATNMKSLIDLRNADTWVCVICGQAMKTA